SLAEAAPAADQLDAASPAEAAPAADPASAADPVEAVPTAQPVVDLWAPPPDPPPATAVEAAEAVPATDVWAPTMPPLATRPSVPWRGPSSSITAGPVVPSLVIDDADPDIAERMLEDRNTKHAAARRSFLPPILLDREDRSARQGGLTLAVIILLIAAT